MAYNSTFYKVYELSSMNHFFAESIGEDTEILQKGKVGYFNLAVSFDIETSSFYYNQSTSTAVKQPVKDKNGNYDRDIWKKVSNMYIWQFGINGNVIYGRTWTEFRMFIEKLVDYLDLNLNSRLVVYVHNLGYEFQYIRKWFQWDKIFAIKRRRPVYAVTTQGIEFRCSLFLSNYSLAYIGDNLLFKYPVRKLTGDLDYDPIRHSSTELTKRELAYCINDVRVVMAYIQEKIEQDEGIINIPLTNTGYVRNFCREHCFYGDYETESARRKNRMNYRAIMKSLKIDSVDEYQQLKRAFSGGFTHASALHACQPLFNVGSADLTSSYPYVMVTQYFPMSRAQYYKVIDSDGLFEFLLKNYCCIFDIEFHNLEPLVDYENILSNSRCQTEGQVVLNNGRIVRADICRTTMTELDFDSVSQFYKWTDCKVVNLRAYKRGYLPRDFIMSILYLYQDKTTLKDVPEKHIEYMVAKNMINSAFGMAVTNIIRDLFEYEGTKWDKLKPDEESEVLKYNNSWNRFLYYGWGIWVTAHARHNLMSAIFEFGDDYVYSDTDSIKGINFKAHEEYFERYNNKVREAILKISTELKIPIKLFSPKTIKGKVKTIGLWDYEGFYERFKTIGAKRYIFVKDGELGITCAGVKKQDVLDYLKKTYGNTEAVLNAFDANLEIPEGHTGKLTSTYLDDPQMGTLVDYLGKKGNFAELSSIHMEPASFSMNKMEDFKKYLQGVQSVNI